MKKYSLRITIATVLSTIFLYAYAQGGCVNGILGPVCAPPGGGIVVGILGPVCGPGQCVNGVLGPVCSSVPGGGATIGVLGPVCVGGCITASSSYCVAPR